MKKIIFTLSLVFISLISNAQIGCFWHENFDGATSTDSVTSFSNNGANTGWNHCSRLQVSVPNSDSAYIGTNDTIMLTTNVGQMNLLGMTYVILEFDQICKIDFFDVARLEVSPDGGNIWFQLSCSEYLGGSPGFCAQGSQFSAASYTNWVPNDSDAIPDNSWWQHEIFDISPFAGDQPDVLVRFIFYDAFIPGTSGTNGWKIDNICVTAAPCELTTPVIVQLPPILLNTVYNLGPYTLNVDVTDNSGIASVWMHYTINGVPDSVLMTNIAGNTFSGDIPAVSDSDTVCYYFVATDASACANQSTYPPSGCLQFIASSGITFPFCDNFDNQNLWVDSAGVGSSVFQLGTPTGGIPATPHSAPNAWDVALNANYLDNSNCYLTSPVFSFAGIVGAEISMWINYSTEICCDFATIEYTIDGTNWIVLNNPGFTTNWYNVFNGWAGTTATGDWVKATCEQPAALNNQPFVMFRFHFITDFSVTSNGFAVDDFCVIPPAPFDAGVATVTQPQDNAPAGVCQDVTVVIENFGLNVLDTLNIYYTIDSAGFVTTYGPFLWTGSLPPGGNTAVTLPCFIVPQGAFDLCSWTVLVNDGFALNDTTCISMVGVPVILVDSVAGPYCDDFDSGNIGWSNVTIAGGAPGTTWQLGAPFGGVPVAPFSAPDCWDVNLNGLYNVNANVALYTPYFDLTNAINPYLSFYINFNTDVNNEDGVRLEYSLNAGPWTVLPDSPGNTVNWYNVPNLASSFLPGWGDGNSATVLQNPTPTGWCRVEHTDMAFMAGQNVQFRFVFTSNAFTNFDGVAIDNFCIQMPPAFDAGVPLVVNPGSNNPAGVCEDVIVTIKNFGITPLTTLNVWYQVDSIGGTGLFGPYLWTGNLAPGQSINDTLPCLIVPAGAFTLCAWTDITPLADGNNLNDTNCINSLGVPIYVLDSLTGPYCDNFDGVNNGWYSVNMPAGALGNEWQLGTPTFGLTNSSYSAPNCWDVNLNTTYTGDADVALYTPFFNLTNAINPYLNFHVNFNTEQNWDGVRLEYSANAGPWIVLQDSPGNTVNWYNMPTIFSSGLPAWAGNSAFVLQNPQTGGWCEVEHNDLAALVGNEVQFRFVFTSDVVVQIDGFSIDNFCFAMPAPFDAGVPQIIQPGGNAPAGSCQPVIVTIENFGFNPLTSFNIYYTIDSTGVPVLFGPFLWTGNLAPGATTTDTLPCFNVPSGAFNICSWTELLNDGNAFNDTSCANSVGVPVIALSYANDYCDDFEGGNAGWSVINSGNLGSTWELGAPNFGITTGAHSGTQAWDINLNTPYTNGADVALYSPIFNFTNANDVILSFWRNHNTETSFDGVRLEYTINGGNTWTLLGGVGSPLPYVNWYTNTVFCSNIGAWAGASGGWKQSQMLNLGSLVPTLNGLPTVQFRFIFCSDASVTVDGFSIDDFCLDVPVPLTASPTSVGNATSGFPCVFEGQNVTFNSTIKNVGTIAMNSVNAQLIIDGSPIVTDPITYAPPLPPNGSQVHSFSTTWLATPGTHTICVVTSLPNGQTDLDPSDDTVCFTIQVCDTIGIASGGSHFTDFESGNPWATYNALTFDPPPTSWELGTPAKTTLNAAHSGTNAWITKLTGNYPNRDTSGLFTPAFNVQAQKIYKISFWHAHLTELYQDGGTVEYSVDYGANWYVLGAAGQPNWFTSFFITALGGVPPGPGWSGYLPFYQYVEHEICFGYDAAVIFRFRFMSDFTVNDEGWVIDDFCFGDMSTTCLTGVDELPITESLLLGQNYPNPTNGTTTIEYTIPHSGEVTMSIINLVGQTVDIAVQQRQDAGKHYVTFDTGNLAPGIYYYELTFNKERLVKKMAVLK